MKLSQVVQVALGILTSVGGFLEIGSIATAAQAGAAFGFQLLWPIALGTVCVIFLIEMSGRLAAVSHHPLPAAVRERFGFNFFFVPLLAETIIDFVVLASEIGGVCLGLQLLTGIAFFYWALPVAFAIWVLLWRGTFGLIEYGVSILGLSTLVFVVAAAKTHCTLGDSRNRTAQYKAKHAHSVLSQLCMTMNRHGSAVIVIRKVTSKLACREHTRRARR